MKKNILRLGEQLLRLDEVELMAIANITPDSFYSESRIDGADQLALRISQFIREGASIIDIGGCSTRPGGAIASEQEEWTRLKWSVPIVKRLFPSVVLSIDTFRPTIARKALQEFGACIINDISGGSEEMYKVVKASKAPYVLTYNNPNILGKPNIVGDMLSFLSKQLDALHQIGVGDVIIDPGFGFNKTYNQDWQIFDNLQALQLFDEPLMVGVSRKSMICKRYGCTRENALTPTLDTEKIAIEKGACILRVHDVGPTAFALVK